MAVTTPYYPKREPEVWPVGEFLPPRNPHAVSVSLPEWRYVIAWGAKEEWLVSLLKTGYPRFFIHKSIESLHKAVLSRLQIADAGCMIFLSPACATRCVEFLNKTADTERSKVVSFRSPTPLPNGIEDADIKWANFDAVIYPVGQAKNAMAYWRQSGEGVTSRQAEYLLSILDHLDVVGQPPTLSSNMQEEDWRKFVVPAAAAETRQLRQSIADLAGADVSDNVAADDVLLYSKGMSAIYAVSRALQSIGKRGSNSVIVYGFPYAETVKVIEMTPWSKFTLLGHGTKEDLDGIEADLERGQRLSVLFCELPSNPQLASPDLPRLRRLADKYDFIIACDETVGSFVNVDTLPYVDVVMTSLTKIFSGASDVMGGSVIVNPRSKHHDQILAALSAEWEDTYFPMDVITMARNCRDMATRVKKCNQNAEALAHLINSHPSVKQVNYPSLVPSKNFYDQCRKEGGGYGYLLSIIFHEPEAAITFYNNLDVPKGPSLGTNFTLAVPYAQIAHFVELDWAAEYDVPPHMIRISAGLEDTEELKRVTQRALDCIA